MTTATELKAGDQPKRSRAPPNSPRRPKASSSAIPPTAGGITTGSCSRISSQHAERQRERASHQASGVPPHDHQRNRDEASAQGETQGRPGQRAAKAVQDGIGATVEQQGHEGEQQE